MEELKFDSSITAKIFHSAKKALHEYVGTNLPEWGRLHYDELNGAVSRVEDKLKGKSLLGDEPSSVELIEEKLLEVILAVLLPKQEKVAVKKEESPVEEVKAEAPKKAPAKKKK